MKGENAKSRVAPGGWVALVLLVAIYVSSFVDRTVLSALGEPIKRDLGLSDTQLGLLGGLAFALTYSILGVPIARIAERRSRKTIIAIVVTIWSVMTALCGAAQGFAQLLAFRAGVGIGEAGFTAPAHALISDFFPPSRRATALSIFSLGIPLGVLIGALAAGWVAASFGWRMAFVAVGLPGLLLALAVVAFLREPARGESEGGAAVPTETPPSFGEVLRYMGQRPALLHIAFSGALVAFAGYGLYAFTVSYFVRQHGVPLAHAATLFGVVVAGSQILGLVPGGFITDLAARRDRRWATWFPALLLFLGGPAYSAAFLQGDLTASIILMGIGGFFAAGFLGPSYAAMHVLLTPNLRATSMSVILLAQSLIGLGFGPPLVGLLSDRFAAKGFDGDFAAACTNAVAGATPDPACAAASANGLAIALSICALFYIWAAIHMVWGGALTRRMTTPAGNAVGDAA